MQVPGWLFKTFFGKDPRKLSLEEIERLAIRKKGKIYKTPSNVVIKRGSIFPTVHYKIDEKLDEAIKKL